MRGRGKEAVATWRQAFALKPDTALSAGEVLDESVLDIFNAQKAAIIGVSGPAAKAAGVGQSASGGESLGLAGPRPFASTALSEAAAASDVADADGGGAPSATAADATTPAAPSPPVKNANGKTAPKTARPSKARPLREKAAKKKVYDGAFAEDASETPEEELDEDLPKLAPEGAKGARKPKKDASYVLAAMPFGIGQFMNGERGLGLGLFVLEVGALSYAFDALSHEQKAKRAESKYRRERTANGTPLTAEDDAYFARSKAYRAKVHGHATLGLAAFGILWLGGATEALLTQTADEAAPAPPKKAKKARGRRTSQIGDDAVQERLALAEDAEDRFRPRLALGLEPDTVAALTFMVGLHWDF
jgi:hypothetical protein